MEPTNEETANQVGICGQCFSCQIYDMPLSSIVGKLGFTKKWHEADGKGTVCQIDRGGGEIIICEDTRRDRGRLFLELKKRRGRSLLKEVSEQSIRTQKIWWGYDVLRIEDPDGNELLICLETLL